LKSHEEEAFLMGPRALRFIEDEPVHADMPKKEDGLNPRVKDLSALGYKP
jgi:hypothetical protein